MTPLRLAALALAAALPACATPPGGDASTGSSTGEPTTEASGSSSDDGNESTSTSAGDSTSATTSGSGEASSSSADSSSGDASTTTSGSTGPVEAGEECDDGNNEPTDGCDECVVSRWTHVGVAQEVPIADLGTWKPCFSSTYEAGATIESILANCNGDHVMLGCMPVGSETLTMAAHAPRADVFFEPQVKYKDGERHLANGVAWYWAPYYGVIGFGPDLGEDFWNPCEKPGEDQQMCWRTAANPPDTFASGYRCGDVEGFSVAESKAWLRVAYEAWD